MVKSKATVQGILEYRQFIILEDGTEVRVRYNQDASLYADTDITVYEYTAKEGKGEDKKEVTRYAVAFDDAIRANRGTSDNIEAMLAKGITADEIVAMAVAKATAKIQAKLAQL